MTRIEKATLRRLKLPLVKPYRLSYRTFNDFEPFLVEITDTEGRRVYGDAHISPGSSAETREGGLQYLTERLPRLVGKEPAEAKALMLEDFEQSKVATTAAVIALEQLEAMPILDRTEAAELPLLVPIGALDEAGIAKEVDAAISAGFRTLKIKVGKDAAADIERVGWIQSAVAGRASLRIDANRAFSRDDAITFVQGVNPEGIALFEQPCEADLWDDNAAVAAASDIPLMLDEPICSLADIERAAEIRNILFCKVKLKRFGGVERLLEGIRHIQACRMSAVLGDGLGSDLHAWFEACVAAETLDNAGEYNGWLKLKGQLFETALHLREGALCLPSGSCPDVDRERLEAATTLTLSFN